jgi:ketosteroid isomerase-like protein
VTTSAAEVVVERFIARINAHDARGVVSLCTADHRFIDSAGTSLTGLDELERAWYGYFDVFPDYRVDIEAMVSSGRLVLLSGWASASLRGHGPLWRVPAAWRSVVAGGLVAEWQVFADNAPVRDVLGRGP